LKKEKDSRKWWCIGKPFQMGIALFFVYLLAGYALTMIAFVYAGNHQLRLLYSCLMFSENVFGKPTPSRHWILPPLFWTLVTLAILKGFRIMRNRHREKADVSPREESNSGFL
jgi:hypothetical protein